GPGAVPLAAVGAREDALGPALEHVPGLFGRPVAGAPAVLGPRQDPSLGQPAQGRPGVGRRDSELGQYGDQGPGGYRPAVTVPVVAQDGYQQSLGTGAADRAGSTARRGCPVFRDLVLIAGFHGLPPVAGPGTPAPATHKI